MQAIYMYTVLLLLPLYCSWASFILCLKDMIFLFATSRQSWRPFHFKITIIIIIAIIVLSQTIPEKKRANDININND